MKILIPTDFSKLSQVAVHYATKMAHQLEAEIILLHVVYINAPPRAVVSIKVETIENAMVENAKEDGNKIINNLKAEVNGNLNIRFEIIKGAPVEDVVETYANHHNIDLIIMGTKGATGIAKVLIGSNAVAIINKSKIPVITVPEFTRFNQLKSIVYATDMINLQKEFKMIVPLAKLFNATIHILHVVAVNSKKKFDTNSIMEKLLSVYQKVVFHISINDNILEGIDEYIANTKSDMLAMFTHNLTFFEKLFGKSATRQMAFHSYTPLYSIKKLG